MINEHATDTQVQQYVLKLAECTVESIAHIESCPACKLKAAQYSMIVEGVKMQEKPMFDFNLADLVIEQLPTAPPKTLPGKLFSCFIIVISVFFGSVVFYLFGNTLFNLFGGVKPILSGLIITTVVCLLAFIAFDMFKKYRARMNALDFY